MSSALSEVIALSLRRNDIISACTAAESAAGRARPDLDAAPVITTAAAPVPLTDGGAAGGAAGGAVRGAVGGAPLCAVASDGAARLFAPGSEGGGCEGGAPSAVPLLTASDGAL